MTVNVKSEKKIGIFKILTISVLGGLESLFLALLALGLDNIIYWAQYQLFASSNIIFLVQGMFLSRFDSIAIIILASAIIVATFFKFYKKLQVLIISTVIWALMIVATVYSCTVFNLDNIIYRSTIHATGITYKYSDVKGVFLYDTIESDGKNRSHVMHYELRMKDGNVINLNANKWAQDFKTELTYYQKIEEKIKDVPHLVENEFIRYYGHLFPRDYFEKFTQLH